LLKCWKIKNNNNIKVAIVTGASIVYATSLALSKAGIRVATGARRIERLRARTANYQKP
jgi:NADP-dependent 3-hydroxy acid dehydrogenase YdfG